MAKFVKKVNKSAKKFNKKIDKWEKKNPGITLAAKVGTIVAGGVATKIVVKQEVKKQLNKELTSAPAPKKSFFGKIKSILPGKKDEAAPVAPIAAEAAPTV